MEKEIECSLCRGTGEYCDHFPLFETCVICKGSGKTTITKEEVEEEISELLQQILDIEEEIKDLRSIFNE